ncbi:MAG: TetR/AcrR family transcriptional regulator [Phenylobacterium sp.]|uniref:TetR/AcrR family transcriptional regulator n=1 Tax=Phenylobacterium sp. TaxID=1871053 RepID=UPI003BB64CBA
MPRVAGQIDLAKGEAILDAAVEVLGERGLAASMEEVARRAGVSKQTIYNHYGSKAELIRALVDRRVADITAPLEMPGADEHPEATLAGFARTMLQAIISPRATAMMRLYIQGAGEAPDVARAVFEAGPKASRARLAAFLARETADGRLAVDDPAMAAEFFGGMVVGTYQLADLLGVDRGLTQVQIDAIAVEAARRFMRAYSV